MSTEFHIGQRVVYFPPKAEKSDNAHPYGVVEKVGKRITVRIFTDDSPPPMANEFVSPLRV